VLLPDLKYAKPCMREASWIGLGKYLVAATSHVRTGYILIYARSYQLGGPSSTLLPLPPAYDSGQISVVSTTLGCCIKRMPGPCMYPAGGIMRAWYSCDRRVFSRVDCLPTVKHSSHQIAKTLLSISCLSRVVVKVARLL
jgi:hypothetical protein